jgi:hypothetical protein
MSDKPKEVVPAMPSDASDLLDLWFDPFATARVPAVVDGWEELAADPDLIVDWDMGLTTDPPDIRGLDDDDAATSMVDWFFANFEDPAHETPWDGEYVYIWGGPYEAREELEEAFGAFATESMLEAAAEEIEKHGLFEWAPAASRMQPEEPGSTLIAAKRRLMDVLRAWRKEPLSNYAAFDIRDVATLLHAYRQLAQEKEQVS